MCAGGRGGRGSEQNQETKGLAPRTHVLDSVNPIRGMRGPVASAWQRHQDAHTALLPTCRSPLRPDFVMCPWSSMATDEPLFCIDLPPAHQHSRDFLGHAGGGRACCIQAPCLKAGLDHCARFDGSCNGFHLSTLHAFLLHPSQLPFADPFSCGSPTHTHAPLLLFQGWDQTAIGRCFYEARVTFDRRNETVRAGDEMVVVSGRNFLNLTILVFQVPVV